MLLTANVKLKHETFLHRQRLKIPKIDQLGEIRRKKMKKQYSVIVKCLNCTFWSMPVINFDYLCYFHFHLSFAFLILERFGCLNNWIEDEIRIRICVVHIIICFQRNVNKFFNLFHRPHDDDDIVFLIVCDQHASCLFVNINIK